MTDIITALAEELATGSDLSVTLATPSIPVPQQTLPSLQQSVQAIKTLLDTREGRSGSVMDKSLTLRDLVDAGSLSITVGDASVGSGTGSSSGGLTFTGGGSGGYVDPRPILTSIPAPTSFSVSGGFHDIIMSWSQVDFQNFSYTEVWRSTTNVLGTATKIGESTARVYVDTTGVLSTLYYFWVRTIGVDTDGSPIYGSYSTSSSGGILMVGTTDLAALSVTAAQLSQGTYPGVNLVPNPAAEDDVACWQIAQTTGSGYSFSADASIFAGGSKSFHINRGAGGAGVGCQAFAVIPGETYAVQFKAIGNVASANGFYVRMYESAVNPTGNYVNSGNAASFTNLLSNGPVTNAWATTQYTYQVPAGVYWVSVAFYCWSTATNTDLHWDDVLVGRQITAVSLAANSIAVGTAAIENGAIDNAMIANATIDSAKIANLDVSLVNAGTMNASFITAGTLTATQIAANTITAGKMSVTQLSAITADMGAITAGTITMPTTGYIRGGQTAYNTGTGFFLGYSTAAYKLSLGNGTQGLTWDGTTLTISGGGTFSGALSAASGTFAGALSAATGTFAGSLSAASGTFAGTLTAGAVNAVNTINIAGNAVTIPVSAFTAGVISAVAGATTVQTASITSSGAPVNVLCGFVYTATVSAPSSFGISILRDGVSIYGDNRTDLAGTWVNAPIQDNPGAGAHTYTIVVTPGASFLSLGASNRGILLLETKR